MNRSLLPGTMAVLLVAGACVRPPHLGPEIDAEQAIRVAREHVTFHAGRAEAERAEDRGHRVWKVTLHHRPGEDGGDAETVVLSVDRGNGRYLGPASN